jgi:hypothetical protein
MARINLSSVQSVYSGKAGKCCCGCAGKHTYASATREQAGKDCGYVITDDEVSDKTVKLIVGKLQALDFEVCGGYVHATDGGRLYIAYLTD